MIRLMEEEVQDEVTVYCDESSHDTVIHKQQVSHPHYLGHTKFSRLRNRVGKK